MRKCAMLAGLLMAAHRMRALTIGADASITALNQGAPLAVVAVDAGAIGPIGLDPLTVR